MWTQYIITAVLLIKLLFGNVLFCYSQNSLSPVSIGNMRYVERLTHFFGKGNITVYATYTENKVRGFYYVDSLKCLTNFEGQWHDDDKQLTVTHQRSMFIADSLGNQIGSLYHMAVRASSSASNNKMKAPFCLFIDKGKAAFCYENKSNQTALCQQLINISDKLYTSIDRHSIERISKSSHKMNKLRSLFIKELSKDALTGEMLKFAKQLYSEPYQHEYNTYSRIVYIILISCSVIIVGGCILILRRNGR